MADMQQLESAFLKAHKAGDKKAAGVLAAEIKRQRAAAQAPQGEVSGLASQFWSGVDQPLEDTGVSVQEAGKALGSDTMAGAGQSMRDFTSKPSNFVSAGSRFINPQKGDSYVDPIAGFGWGNLPGAVAEQAGGLAGNIAARSAGGLAGSVAGPEGAAAGAFAGPALFNFIRQVGPDAKQRAQNDGREEPNWQDWAAAAATAGVSGALESIGVGKIGILNQGVKEIGTKTATKVVTEVAKETGKKALKEGATEAGQSLVEQYGTTAGTKTGAQIDLKQALGEGVIGAGTGATVDAGRQAKPLYNAVTDSLSVDRSMRNNPDAQMQAEVIDKVNGIADRMKGAGKAPLSQEINNSVKNLKNQIVETLKNQNLSPEDKTALKNGLNTATGMDAGDMDAIAGRSENPDEMRALIRKIQVVREMTMQRQTAKGFRGALAGLAYHGGAALGGAVGSMTGTPQGSAAGSYIGDRIGTSIARSLRGSQTQGAAIDALVGAKQARRAKLLLDRYGPSEATNALNTLTVKAAANKAAAEAEAQAKQDFQNHLSSLLNYQKLKKKSLDDEKRAKNEEERTKAKDERSQFNSAYREIRLKDQATRAAINATRHQKLVQDLEHKTTTNALTVELQQLRNDLAQKQAEAKAEGMDRAKQEDIARIQGRMDMTVLEIQKRQEALKKATIATKRAQIQLDRLQSGERPSVQKMAKAAGARVKAKSTSWAEGVVPEVDSFGRPIRNKVGFEEKKQLIQGLQNEGMDAAEQIPNKELGNLFIAAINDFKMATGPKNQTKRMAIYERIMREVDPKDVDAHRFIVKYIRPLAYAFEGDTNTGGGREDFGSPDGPGEDPPF